MKAPFIRCIPYCHSIPWWLGFVHNDYLRGRTALAPVPLNLIYRLAFISWCWLRHPIKRCKVDHYHNAFMRGRAYERLRQADRRRRQTVSFTIKQKP